MNKYLNIIDDRYFKDDYDAICSIQISSAIEPHIWLGRHDPDLKVLWKNAEKLGLNVPKKCGWYDYPIPDEVQANCRMHLNQTQARQLANMLLYFADYGLLPLKTNKCPYYKFDRDKYVCVGTKEKDPCWCDGDQNRCSFVKE